MEILARFDLDQLDHSKTNTPNRIAAAGYAIQRGLTS